MTENSTKDFQKVHVDSYSFDLSKQLAEKNNVSEHEALTDMTVNYLQNYYAKEMEEDPNFITIEGLLDGSSSILDRIPGHSSIPKEERGLSYNNILHTLTDYKQPDTSDFIETGARELAKGAVSGVGFGKAAAATGSAIMPALTTAAGLPGFLLGGLLSLGAGLVGGAATYSAADAVLDKTFGDDPEVLTGTSGKTLTEGIRSFTGAFGGSLPLAFSKKVSNLGAKSLAKGLGKKALDTTDDAINAMIRTANENRGTFVLSEAIASAPIGVAGAGATSIGYDKGWERLGFEVLGGFTGGAAAAGALKLLPSGVRGAIDLGSTTKGALSKGTDSLNDVNSTVAGMESVPPEQAVFMKRAREYMNEYGLEQEGEDIVKAIAEGAMYAEDLQKAVREVAESKPDLFTEAELRQLKGELSPTVGQAAPEGFVSDLQAVLSNKEDTGKLRVNEESYERLLNLVTSKYIQNLKNSGDENKVLEAIKLNEGFLEGQFKEAYAQTAGRFLAAQTKVYGEKPLNKTGTSQKFTELMSELDDKISKRTKELYKDLNLEQVVYTPENTNTRRSKPSYQKVYEKILVEDPDFANKFKTISARVEDHRSALGLGRGPASLTTDGVEKFNKVNDSIFKKYSKVKPFIKNRFKGMKLREFNQKFLAQRISLEDKQKYFADEVIRYELLIKNERKTNSGLSKGPKNKKNERNLERSQKRLKAYTEMKNLNKFASEKYGEILKLPRQYQEVSRFKESVSFGDLDSLRREILSELRGKEVKSLDRHRLSRLANEGLLKDLNKFSKSKATKENDNSYMNVISFVKAHRNFTENVSLQGLFGQIAKKKNRNKKDPDAYIDAESFRKLFRYKEKDVDLTAISYENLRNFAAFADKYNLDPEANYRNKMDTVVTSALRNHLDEYGLGNILEPPDVKSFSESLQTDPIIKMDEFKRADLSKLNKTLNEFFGRFKDKNIPQLNELRNDFENLEEAGVALETFINNHNKNLEDEMLFKWIYNKTDKSNTLINILRDSYKSKNLKELDKLLGLGKTFDKTGKSEQQISKDKSDFKKGILKLILEYATTGSTASVSNKQNVFDAHQFYDILFGKINEDVTDSLMDRVYANGIINKNELERIKKAAILKRNAADYLAKRSDSSISDPSGLTKDTTASIMAKLFGKFAGLRGAAYVSKKGGFGGSSLALASAAARGTDYILDKLPSQLKDDLRNEIFLDPILFNKVYKMSEAGNIEELKSADTGLAQAILQSLKKNDYSSELLGNLLIAPLMKYRGPASRATSEEAEGPTEDYVQSLLAQLRKLPALKDFVYEVAEDTEGVMQGVGQAATSLGQAAVDGLKSGVDTVGDFVGNLGLTNEQRNTRDYGNPFLRAKATPTPTPPTPTPTSNSMPKQNPKSVGRAEVAKAFPYDGILSLGLG